MLLCSYNLRESDIDVVDIAFKRSVSVTVGVVYAFIVSRVWWPSEARRELSIALGEYVTKLHRAGCTFSLICPLW
jgi:hypothetical protein